MNYYWYLLLAYLSINSVHSYLLWSQKSKRRWSISEHAALNNRTLSLYIVGHLVGGLSFLLFAKSYYLTTHHYPAIFALVCITVAFEYLQAFLPAKGKTNTVHTIAALLMWFSTIAVIITSLFVLHVTLTRTLIAAAIDIAILAYLVKAYVNKERLYKYQMIMITLFYISLLVLVS